MRIATLVLRDYGPFKGEHVLELSARAYGITATSRAELERSNWCGKTMLLEAVRLALYGWHRHRLADAWIHRGAVAGMVRLETDDGLVAERSRARGKTTQLLVDDRGSKCRGEEAQRLLVERVGLTREDFEAGPCLAQKQMARFVTADPAERLALVGGWMRLARLVRLEEVLRGRMATARTCMDRWSLAARTSLDVEGDPAAHRARLVEALNQRCAEVTRFAAVVTRLEEERDRLVEWERAARDAAEYARVVAEGKTLVAGDDGASLWVLRAADIRTVHDDAVGKHRTAEHDRATKRLLVHGQFDGTCPVTSGACPVADGLRAGRRAAETALGEAERAYASAAAVRHRAEQHLAELDTALRAAAVRDERLAQLRSRARALAPAQARIKRDGPPPDAGAQAARLALAREQYTTTEHARLQAEHALSAHDTAVARAVAARQGERAAQEEAAALREAVGVAGPNGAQRRVAEQVLGEVERRANELLAGCGVDLRVAVRWEREGRGLAHECDACGQPIAGQKAAPCPRCGAPRGPAYTPKLDLVPSAQSGAADDLVGAAFQLAAAAWLREDRACAWSVALLDEPFGALDAANRRALAQHLPGLLRAELGFEQALIVAHQPETMAALPGRIEVVGEGAGWSSARVVA